jgi:uncharacterized protein
MRKIKCVTLLLAILVSIYSFGQNNSNLEEVPYIEVNGTAEKEIVPDEIFIEIVIRERYNNKTKISVEDQEAKLKKAILSIGIDLINLSLADANADYVKVNWQKKDVLTKKEYTLKVSNATLVGQVFQELEKLEITEASVFKVSHSKLDQFKKDVRIMAIKAAKEKADYLLEAIGEETGKPLTIRENDYLPYGNVNTLNIRRQNNSELEASFDKSLSDEIQFQKIKIQTSVYVKFSIK